MKKKYEVLFIPGSAASFTVEADSREDAWKKANDMAYSMSTDDVMDMLGDAVALSGIEITDLYECDGER